MNGETNVLTNQIGDSLDRAIIETLQYHAHLPTDARDTIWEELESNIGALDPWDLDEDVAYTIDLDILKNLHENSGGVGVYIYEGSQAGEVNVMMLFAIWIFFRALDGKQALAVGDVARAAYIAAMVHEGIRCGEKANSETEATADRRLKTIANENNRRNAGRIKNMKIYGPSKAIIIDDFEKILADNLPIVELRIPMPLNAVCQEITLKFKALFPDRPNLKQCAKYLYQKHVKLPESLGKRASIMLKEDAIYRCITDHYRQRHLEA
ncbi:hypothetical protein KP003_02965 [Geomonas nitrogeniifigens]|uniref:hypothetical protein n=1 Tax=Geomonas diazotrophica TaxID=2843197 RepID=UPI001C2B8549|nr:hypothetical protein [Geomonas nitrogeniifigens]QXE87386.1 hypothetical protein KP003_02965 [Geomonas nitrogeniifigens]